MSGWLGLLFETTCPWMGLLTWRLMIMNDYYVYGYSDPNSPDPYFYIGKGLGNRAYTHLIKCINNQTTPFYKKLKVILDRRIQPDIQILDSELTEEQAHEVEIKLIRLYGRRINGGMLLNETDGGEGISGHKKSELEILKMKLRTTGKSANAGSFKIGHIITDETKKKMSESLFGDKERQHKCHAAQLKSFSKPFAKCSLFGNQIIQIFMNIREVTRYGYCHNLVSDVLKGKRKQHKNWSWRYLTSDETKTLLKQD